MCGPGRNRVPEQLDYAHLPGVRDPSSSSNYLVPLLDPTPTTTPPSRRCHGRTRVLKCSRATGRLGEPRRQFSSNAANGHAGAGEEVTRRARLARPLFRAGSGAGAVPNRYASPRCLGHRTSRRHRARRGTTSNDRSPGTQERASCVSPGYSERDEGLSKAPAPRHPARVRRHQHPGIAVGSAWCRSTISPGAPGPSARRRTRHPRSSAVRASTGLMTIKPPGGKFTLGKNFQRRGS